MPSSPWSVERGVSFVRPLLTLFFAGTIVYLALNGSISVDFIQGLAAGIINFWFGERAGAHMPDQLPHQE